MLQIFAGVRLGCGKQKFLEQFSNGLSKVAVSCPLPDTRAMAILRGPDLLRSLVLTKGCD